MQAQGDPSEDILPNIGYYSCWLGSEYNPDIEFHKTPRFLYFYVIIVFTIFFNIVCFIRTGAYLFSHWWGMRGMAQGSINELFKNQLLTVTKLFFIMVFPMGFDVISAAAQHAYGRNNSYSIRIALDILYFLSGLLIFISLACKKIVWEKLKQKFSKLQYSAANSSEL